VVRELMEVYQFYASEADNKTGIPKYSYGSSDGTGGALGTATGFSMMMNNASRGIKNVVRNIDNGIIKPSVERTHEFQLLFFNDPEYHQGDIKIIAKGSTAMVAKEQAAVRRNELLQVVTSSEAALNIIGQRGLASMLREIFKAADFQDDEIVPDKRAMIQREQQEQAAMQQEQAMVAQQEQAQLDQQTDPAGNVAGGKDARTV
jgi:long-subunit acyl-CoA synthetase (AMP-forming)